MDDLPGVLIGVDVGGTHTDLSLAIGSDLHRAKALTTHDDYSQGIVDAVDVAAAGLNLERRDLLKRCETFVTATTIVTNAVTEIRGARVGVLITKGFRDTFRLLGGFRSNDYDDHLQLNPPEIVPKRSVIEIEERIDSTGRIIVGLDEDEVREGIAILREQGVTAIAVCLLWSFKEPGHEQRVRELINEEWPEAFVTLSSEVHPVIREYERFLTAVFNCFCQPAATRLIDTVGARLAEDGFVGRLSFFSGAGGAISADLARKFPILLLASGPAGGVMGSADLAAAMGYQDVLTGDMGGTSFDAALVRDGAPTITPRFRLGELETGISLVDVVSIGAGGGSIAWTDERGVPQVGPHSAGSSPGPACYGRGGTDPTVTDAAAVLGIIDPGNYLGGRFQLDRDASTAAIAAIAEPHGWSVEQASEAICELVATNMAYALRRISVERGHDPRAFLFFAFGGTLPMFVTRICRQLAMTQAVVPRNSSVFSAVGVLTADYIRRYSRTVEWDLRYPQHFNTVNERRAEMLELARREATDDGFDFGDCALDWSADLRFQGQVYEVAMPLDDRPFGADDAARLAQEFPAVYERQYGKGAAWPDSAVHLLNLNATCSAARPRPESKSVWQGKAGIEATAGSSRLVALGGRPPTETPVYVEAELPPGTVVRGPAVIDMHDTTLVVDGGWSALRDGFHNFVLTHDTHDSNNGDRPAKDEGGHR